MRREPWYSKPMRTTVITTARCLHSVVKTRSRCKINSFPVSSGSRAGYPSLKRHPRVPLEPLVRQALAKNRTPESRPDPQRLRSGRRPAAIGSIRVPVRRGRHRDIEHPLAQPPILLRRRASNNRKGRGAARTNGEKEKSAIRASRLRRI